jgi:hypothetical protein
MRAACLLDACHALPEVGDRLDHRRFRWRPIGRRAGGRQSVLLARRREQAVVTDALETGRQDGFQKTVDELGAGRAQGALLAAGGIGADAQEHVVAVVAVDAEDTLVGDRHPVRVATEVFEYRFQAAQRLLGIAPQSCTGSRCLSRRQSAGVASSPGQRCAKLRVRRRTCRERRATGRAPETGSPFSARSPCMLRFMVFGSFGRAWEVMAERGSRGPWNKCERGIFSRVYAAKVS